MLVTQTFFQAVSKLCLKTTWLIINCPHRVYHVWCLSWLIFMEIGVFFGFILCIFCVKINQFGLKTLLIKQNPSSRFSYCTKLAQVPTMVSKTSFSKWYQKLSTSKTVASGRWDSIWKLLVGELLRNCLKDLNFRTLMYLLLALLRVSLLVTCGGDIVFWERAHSMPWQFYDK